MEDNTFIKYTRSLHTNPVYKSLSFEYRHIFMTILVHMAFKPIQLNDHGVLIDLKPGQFMTTIRGLAKLCDEKEIDAPKVQRALTMFENVGFSIQETIHRKTIITIKEPSICESMKKPNDTGIDTKSIQDRYTKEERQEIQERKEHTPQQEIKVVGGECEIIPFSSSIQNFFPSCAASSMPIPKKPDYIPVKNSYLPEGHFNDSSTKAINFNSEPPKAKYGALLLIRLSSDQEKALMKEMDLEEINHWIKEVEFEKNTNPETYQKRYRDDYTAIIRFKHFREQQPNYKPPYKSKKIQVNAKENQDYSLDAQKNLVSKHSTIIVSETYVEINAISICDQVKFTDNDFKKKFDHLLHTKGFTDKNGLTIEDIIKKRGKPK